MQVRQKGAAERLSTNKDAGNRKPCRHIETISRPDRTRIPDLTDVNLLFTLLGNGYGMG
jgi:hypothetical protein